MLAKLLKYDLKKHISFFLIIDTIAILAAVIARLAASGSSAFMIFVHEFSVGAAFAMAANAIVNTGFRGFAKFRLSLYGDESYLTHTLPVKASTIFWSKFLETFIILLFNFVVTAIAIIIAYGFGNLKDFFDSAFGILVNGLDISMIVFVLSLVGILFLEIFNIIIVGYLGCILGYKKDSDKALHSFADGVIIYLLTQIAVVAAVVIAGLFNHDLFSIFASDTSGLNPEVIRSLFVVSFMTYLAMPPALGLIAAKSLSKGVNVE